MSSSIPDNSSGSAHFAAELHLSVHEVFLASPEASIAEIYRCYVSKRWLRSRESHCIHSGLSATIRNDQTSHLKEAIKHRTKNGTHNYMCILWHRVRASWYPCGGIQFEAGAVRACDCASDMPREPFPAQLNFMRDTRHTSILFLCCTLRARAYPRQPALQRQHDTAAERPCFQRCIALVSMHMVSTTHCWHRLPVERSADSTLCSTCCNRRMWSLRHETLS